jgi:nitroimidazol reductase NimA-like FMN-containing flavoprotein (pyridoxamine 5'-phosphate oxidase superfamily)
VLGGGDHHDGVVSAKRGTTMDTAHDRPQGRTDAAGYLVLDRGQCLRYLAAGGVGRVAVNVAALPAILPVHFALDGDRVVFTIAAGSTLARATRDAVVAFETDGQHADGGGYWSVTATGMARHVEAGAADGCLPTWTAAERRQVVTISTDYLSGRRSM